MTPWGSLWDSLLNMNIQHQKQLSEHQIKCNLRKGLSSSPWSPPLTPSLLFITVYDDLASLPSQHDFTDLSEYRGNFLCWDCRVRRLSQSFVSSMQLLTSLKCSKGKRDKFQGATQVLLERVSNSPWLSNTRKPAEASVSNNRSVYCFPSPGGARGWGRFRTSDPGSMPVYLLLPRSLLS